VTETAPNHTTAPLAEPDAQPITKATWTAIEQRLSNPYGRVELLADGYRIAVNVERYKALSWKLVVYINGEIKFEWLREDSEETRKFWRRRERFLHQKKYRDDMKKWLKSRDEWKRDMAQKAHATLVVWDPAWPNAKVFCRHIRKTCTDIRLIKTGY
jgi:hypothetical protein